MTPPGLIGTAPLALVENTLISVVSCVVFSAIGGAEIPDTLPNAVLFGIGDNASVAGCVKLVEDTETPPPEGVTAFRISAFCR